VLNGPEESLAFVLADAGFDVFLANSRGNEYGRGGVAGGGATSAYFWQWSWDEMAAFDLPAAVAAVLHLSGQSSLSLVAFSQGTTVALAALAAGNSMLPPRSIRQALLLGPVAYATHVDSVPLQRLADLGTDQALLLLGAREFSPSGELLRRLSGDLCSSAPELCVSALTAICGFNAYNADPARIPRYLNYTPSGTSTQNMAHWAQAVRGGGRGGGGGGSGGGDDDDDGGGVVRRRRTLTQKKNARSRMIAFDYGTVCETPLVRWPRPCNQRVYGSRDAPEYDLASLGESAAFYFAAGGGGGGEGRRGSAVASKTPSAPPVAPIVLFTGGRDRLADPEDAAELAAVLKRARWVGTGGGVGGGGGPPSSLLRALHFEPSFEHLDFLWGVRVLGKRGGVYDLVVRELWAGLGEGGEVV
jgi:hypothetical protein